MRSNCSIYNLARGEYGLQSNALRNKIWPKLLGINRYEDCNSLFLSDEELMEHRDAFQVQCDIDRSLWNLKTINSDCDMSPELGSPDSWNDIYLMRKRNDLKRIILTVLCKNKQLYYYQGFHDIISVLYLVLEDAGLALAAAEKMATTYLSDIMQKDFNSILQTLPIIITIIKETDIELYEFLVQYLSPPSPVCDARDPASVAHPSVALFSLCNYITWFAHDMRDVRKIAWIFDIFLSSEPFYCAYFCAGMLLHYRDDILHLKEKYAQKSEKSQLGEDGEVLENSNLDFSVLHSCLSNLARERSNSENDSDKTANSSPDSDNKLEQVSDIPNISRSSEENGESSGSIDNGTWNDVSGDVSSSSKARNHVSKEFDIIKILEFADNLKQTVAPDELFRAQCSLDPIFAALVKENRITIFQCLFSKTIKLGSLQHFTLAEIVKEDVGLLENSTLNEPVRQDRGDWTLSYSVCKTEFSLFQHVLVGLATATAVWVVLSEPQV